MATMSLLKIRRSTLAGDLYHQSNVGTYFNALVFYSYLAARRLVISSLD